MKDKHYSLAALAAAGLFIVTLSPGYLSVSQAQDNPSVPPAPPAADQDRPPRPDEGGPSRRGERAPHPPSPDVDEPLAKPLDLQAAPVAVKTASDALAGLSVGQIWTHKAPRGEQQLQATVMFQGKEVARLEFDPGNGSLLTRGQHLPASPAGPRERRGSAPHPNMPVPPVNGPETNKLAEAPVPPAPDVSSPAAEAPAPVAPVNLDPLKAKLPEIVKDLSVGQGAEIMPREGYWKVPLIYHNRVVGELHLSGDGTKMMQDFGAARDAAIFAR